MLFFHEQVSLDTGAYLSAGLSKTCLYDPDDVNSIEQCEQVYKVRSKSVSLATAEVHEEAIFTSSH